MTTNRADRTRFVTLVYNPVKVDAPDLRAAVIAAAHRAGWAPPRFLETTIEDPGQGATRAAIDDGASGILVAGGDGTVRAVSEAIAGTGVPLTIVPSGTGNLLARNLQLPLTARDDVIATAFDGDRMPVDVGRAQVTRADGSQEDHVFVVMAGIGLDAAMIRNTKPGLKKSVGWVAYVDGAARSLPTAEPFRIMYQLDDDRLVSTRTHSLLWANCGQLPAGIALMPDAAIDDGLLDIGIFQPKRWWEWLLVWRTVWWQNSVLRRSKAGRAMIDLMPANGAVRFLQGNTLEAAVHEPQPIELDGDEFGEAVRMRGRVDPGALVVTVPHGHRIDPNALMLFR